MRRLALPRSFRGRLLLLVLLATASGVMVQSAVIRIVELVDLKPTALAELSTDADVIAIHGAAAVAFNDPDAGTETLGALYVAPKVLAAFMFDRDGALFAAYRRSGEPVAAAERRLQGHRFEGRRLLLGRSITYQGEALGSLVMVYDLGVYYDDIWRNFLISIGIGAMAVGMAMLAALRLQRGLAEPVGELVSAARRVSRVRDYSVRVPRRNEDELGELTDSFNEMLGTIEAREAALREATRSLEVSNEQLQQFAYVASHDLQEPLRKIQTFASLLKDDHGPHLPDEARDYLDRMDAAATRMRSLITDLLTYSRVSSKAPNLCDVDLNEIVEGVLCDLEVRLQENNGSVEVDELPVVRADELHMRQLMQNLIGNALKFSRPGIPPAVKVRARGGRPGIPAQFTVEDNGIGFEQRYADRIFLPFQRLHGRGAYEGTGMGLAVCRRIADHYGWTLTATSRPDEGATFTVTLPAGAAAHVQDPSRRPQAVKGAAA